MLGAYRSASKAAKALTQIRAWSTAPGDRQTRQRKKCEQELSPRDCLAGHAFDRQPQPRVGIGPCSPTCRSFEESHVIELGHMRELSLQGESWLASVSQRLPPGRRTRFVSGVSATRNSVSPRPIVPRAMPVARMSALTPPRPAVPPPPLRDAAAPRSSNTAASASKR